MIRKLSDLDNKIETLATKSELKAEEDKLANQNRVLM